MFDQPIQLTPEQVQFYEDNGYLVVENTLNTSECEKAIEAFEYHAKMSNNAAFAAVMNLDRPEEWTHVYGPNGHWIHGYVRQMIVKHPVLITILETLQKVDPGNLVIIQTMFLYKKVGSEYQSQAWNLHQDGYYHKSWYGGTITGNIALTDQDKENGCLFIYPGSHKIGHFLPAKEVKSFHEKPGSRPGHDVGESLPDEFRGKEIDLVLKQGSVLILHGGVVHGSYPNVSKHRDRPMFLAPYKTLDAPFSVGNGISKRMEIPIR